MRIYEEQRRLKLYEDYECLQEKLNLKKAAATLALAFNLLTVANAKDFKTAYRQKGRHLDASTFKELAKDNKIPTEDQNSEAIKDFEGFLKMLGFGKGSEYEGHLRVREMKGGFSLVYDKEFEKYNPALKDCFEESIFASLKVAGYNIMGFQNCYYIFEA